MPPTLKQRYPTLFPLRQSTRDSLGTKMSAVQPIIEEPPEVIQFQYNSDWPTLSALAPADFPPADPSPCARITTRIYDAKKNTVETVQNVLVKTMLPARRHSHGAMHDDSSSSSSSSSDSDNDDDDVMMQDNALTTTGPTTTPSSEQPQQEERAYWAQRTIREAIYGRVLYAIVLKRRPRSNNNTSDVQADWQVTNEKCAIKEMSWQHIRKERDRLAEDPIKEVSAMNYLQKWYQSNSASPSDPNDFYGPMMATNIMMPLDLLSDDRHLYSIMPFASGGELFDRLDLNERFSEEEARYWMHQVLNVRHVVVIVCLYVVYELLLSSTSLTIHQLPNPTQSSSLIRRDLRICNDPAFATATCHWKTCLCTRMELSL